MRHIAGLSQRQISGNAQKMLLPDYTTIDKLTGSNSRSARKATH
jgi:hypothetical protein